VYGPTDPSVHGPFNPSGPVSLHRKDLVCSPCYTMAGTADCPLGHTMCMRLVPVADMLRSALHLLAERLPRPEDQLLMPQQDAL
jgi:hypothetical protein